jgi:hypothetical protein
LREWPAGPVRVRSARRCAPLNRVVHKIGLRSR